MTHLDSIRLYLGQLLAATIKESYPGALLGAGATTEVGFYYDVHLTGTIGTSDLAALQERMKHRLVSGQILAVRSIKRDVLRRRLQEHGESLRLEVLPEEKELYLVEAEGYVDYATDLPQVPGDAAFELTAVSGAYWLGDESQTMLTRITGVAFSNAEELEAYRLARSAREARDHRRLGQELDLFTICNEVGRGLPLLKPGGAAIRRELERFIIDEELARGYEQVYTPAIARRELFETSGHLAHYSDSMFPPIRLEDDDYILRPMTCPHHFMLYNSAPHSYRELPIRYTEISPLYRKERSGELYGLVRVLEFHLADSHIMCRHDQVQAEFLDVIDLVQYVMDTLGLTGDCSYRASLHDPADGKYEGGDWQEAETLLLDTLRRAKLPYETARGEASFYGPKLDVQMRNIHGREETVFTIQIDFLLPERFGMTYTDADGQGKRPVVIHRSSVGCIERTMAFLIEKYAGALPTWLAPVQVKILPVGEDAIAPCRQLARRMRLAGLRAEVDDRGGTVGKRVHNAQSMKVPYTLVVGQREIADDTVSVRRRGDTQTRSVGGDLFVETLGQEVAGRSLTLVV